MDFRETLQFFLRAFLISLGFSRVHAGKCGLDQVLTAKGKCVDCEFCPPGQGMDLQKEVQ